MPVLIQDNNETYITTERTLPASLMTNNNITDIETANCEHISILRALVEYPQGNLEEIQEKTLWSTQDEPGGR